MIDDRLVDSFEELLEANECSDAEELAEAVNGIMDGNGFVEIEWTEAGVGVVVGFGTRGIQAHFEFPGSLSEFWQVVEETADEVEDLAVRILGLPTIEADDNPSTLGVALSDRLLVTQEQVLNAIGGGWTSCDDLISDELRGEKHWYSAGDPVLAVIGIDGKETTIADVELVQGGYGRDPSRFEFAESMDVGTGDLLSEADDTGSLFLNDVIRKARLRLRLCRGCHQPHRHPSKYDTHEFGAVQALCVVCASDHLGISWDF